MSYLWTSHLWRPRILWKGILKRTTVGRYAGMELSSYLEFNSWSRWAVTSLKLRNFVISQIHLRSRRLLILTLTQRYNQLRHLRLSLVSLASSKWLQPTPRFLKILKKYALLQKMRERSLFRHQTCPTGLTLKRQAPFNRWSKEVSSHLSALFRPPKIRTLSMTFFSIWATLPHC